MTSADTQLERTIKATTDRPFSFEQGSSLHAGLLGMVLRPSGPHDEDPFVSGTSRDGLSQASLDLAKIHDEPSDDSPPLTVWFDQQRTVLDISAAFGGAPADALEGSGIPAAVVAGPVAVDTRGDAGDGTITLLTQMCGGKLVIDPLAMLELITSPKVVGFAESATKEYLPLRAFNAQMVASEFVRAVGFSSAALVNQLAVLGYDMRAEVGPEAVEEFENYLGSTQVDLAWFIDEQDRVQTVQAVINLTDFFADLLRRESVLEKMASEEGCTAAEMLEFVDQTAAQNRLVYVNVNWQTFLYSDDVGEIQLPDAPDISADFASKAAQLRQQSAPAPTGSAVSQPPGERPTNVTVATDMLDTMRASSGAMHFVLTDVDGDAVAAMHAAQHALAAIRHPDEPAEALASFLSEVVPSDRGAQFWADISDMEEEPQVLEAVLATVAGAIGSTVASGHLGGTTT